MSRAAAAAAAGTVRSRATNSGVEKEKPKSYYRLSHLPNWRRWYLRFRFSVCGWRPILLLFTVYLLLRGPFILLNSMEGNGKTQQETLRKLMLSTTREVAYGIRKFVINPEKTTFTRKGQGNNKNSQIGKPPTLDEVARQAWVQGHKLAMELQAEVDSMQATQGSGTGRGNSSLTRSVFGSSAMKYQSSTSATSCQHWMLVTGQQLRTNGGQVQLPCGMALHSALTMVALVTSGRSRRGSSRDMATRRPDKLEFVVEVLGLALVGVEEPTVIYHLSVRPSGDWTGKQVIEQNTCYRSRWGDPLRCEGPPSSPLDDTVDGQPRCEKWASVPITALKDGRKLADATAGGRKLIQAQGAVAAVGTTRRWSEPGGATAGAEGGVGAGTKGAATAGEARESTTGASVHEDSVAVAEWPFPVQPDVQFVMTIRAGRQGFHVSVDGSHVVSFPYRSGNPLQEASALRVSGSLAVHSMFFTAMPTTPPSKQGLLEPSEILTALPLRPKEQPIQLFIGILSSSNHFAERMAVRKSWLQHPLIRSGDVVPRFFLALSTSIQINLEVHREAEMYGDLVVLPFIDRYDLVVLKTVAICRFGVENVTATYIMKVDDDNFVRLDAVMDELEHSGFTSGLYMGSINEFHKPLRDGKWAVTEEEWPETNYPPYANGPGYIITKDIASFITTMDSRGYLRLFKMEDVSMGMWVVQYGINNTIHYVHNWRFCHTGCMEDYITAHYQSPLQMICLWKKLTRGQVSCC